MSTLTPAEIVQWFRQKAREYNTKADDLERDFNIAPAAAKTPVISIVPPLPPSDPIKSEDTEAVASFLSKKNSARVADIAKATGFDVLKVIAILQNPTFVKGDQGWWRNKPALKEMF